MICLRYDLRSDPKLGRPLNEVYSAALEQAAWADEHMPIEQLRLSEHHGVDDGYCPAPIVAAGGFAAVTRRLRILLCAVILPLHDPIEIAEELAVLDHVSQGRIDVVFGAGYRASEFELYAKSAETRFRVNREGIALVRRCWTGQEFELHGRRVRVTPAPVQHPHPPLLLGGSTITAARHAARLGVGFMPGISSEELLTVYMSACAEFGNGPGKVVLSNPPMGVFVTDDPERFWDTLGPLALHEASSYGRWEAEMRGNNGFERFGPADVKQLRSSGLYAAVTPDDCVALYNSLRPGEALILHPLLSGMDIDLSWGCLERFRSAVLPRLTVSGAAALTEEGAV